MADSELELLIERATRPYRSFGRYAWHFARSKLRHDPLFRHPLETPLPSSEGTILDLGCGQGVLFAWLAATGARPGVGAENGGSLQRLQKLHAFEWRGMELSPHRVEIARHALGGVARIDCCDIRAAAFPRAATIVIADVLLYMSAEEQCRVLEKATRALEPGGTLLLREADAGAGLRFHITALTGRVAAAACGGFWQRLGFRGVGEWCCVLDQLGLTVTTRPMSEGTPFANVLYVARKR